LLKGGQTEAACEKLNASYVVEPGVGTLLLLGHCYETLGKTASAWAQFRSAESFAKASNQPRRAEIARLRAAALEPSLSRLILRQPKDGVGRDYEILRNGSAVPIASLNVPLPVDPGPQTLEISAPGRQPARVTVTVPAGAGTTDLTLPSLLPVEKAKASPSPRSSKQLVRQAPRELPRAPSRWPAYASFALGIAGVAAGGTFGVLAKAAYDDSGEFCRTETLCSKPGLELRETAAQRADVSTIAFAAGGALLTTGIVYWIATVRSEGEGSDVRRRVERPRAALGLSTTVAVQGAGLKLTGSW
jgi:hypothetical protein